MAAELLSTASTAANSSDVTVTASAPVTVCMKDQADPRALINILLKDEDGAYHKVGELTPAQHRLVITGPGLYRLSRVAGYTCGAFSG
jgi:hypothetical protein